ncbi:hypothetical protein SCHPADRAFT_665759 [Schizopora paradoxa]|uniref:DUF1275 domain protein n=1 Tax=Schizopora paradoxa TaxID=27342 RepID=A0A0H2R5D9_9AGAM|nr:hypothetical protein SCHPADRAFT_665759 [Schizopora paradoxa]
MDFLKEKRLSLKRFRTYDTQDSVQPRDVEVQSARSISESGFSSWRAFKKYIMTDVDPSRCTAILTAYCFLTGITDAVSFTAIFIWCGFMTGNTVQLALSLGRIFSPSDGDLTFRTMDKQSLTALCCFAIGILLGRIGDRIGAHTRLWLFLGTMLQTLFIMGAAITTWKGNQPSVAEARDSPAWTQNITFLAIALMSAALGLQGIMAKRIPSQFGTTVVLTTVWVELVGDPHLFKLRHVPSRDHRILEIAFFFLGAVFGRALLDQIGSAGTLGIGTAIRFVVALFWLAVPEKPFEEQ